MFIHEGMKHWPDIPRWVVICHKKNIPPLSDSITEYIHTGLGCDKMLS